VAVHGEGSGYIVQLLGHVLTDAFEELAAAADTGVQLMPEFLTGQLSWQ
jgi:hypothetical protein